MKKNGYTVVELIIVLAVIGVIYFIIANNVSYAFSVDYDDELYNQTISSILYDAKVYGENNLNIFDSDKDIYITVDELAQAGVLLSMKDGVVVDPRDNNKNLNELKIKLSYDGSSVTAKLLG